jgi:hypothetical protein
MPPSWERMKIITRAAGVHRNESQFPLAVRQGASAGEHRRKGNGAIGMAPRCDAPNPLYVLLPHAKTEPVEVSVKASWYPAPTAVTLVPEADQPGRGQTGYGHQTPQRNPAPPCWHISRRGDGPSGQGAQADVGASHKAWCPQLSSPSPAQPDGPAGQPPRRRSVLRCENGARTSKGGVEHVQNPHRSVPQRPRVRY